MNKLSTVILLLSIVLALTACVGTTEVSPPISEAPAAVTTPTTTDTPTKAPTATPTPQPTATPTLAPSSTPTPKPTVTPTATALPTDTPRPTVTPQPVAVVTAKGLHVRSGPGTVYPVVGRVAQGDSLPVLARNEDASWLEIALANGSTGWVFAELVDLPLKTDSIKLATNIPLTPAAGIGVSRAEIQQSFEDIGFKFGAVTQSDGQPVVTGKLGLYDIELRGPANNLTRARIRIYALGGQDVQDAGGVLMALFLAYTVPDTDLVAIGNWMSQNSSAAVSEGIQRKWGRVWLAVSTEGSWLVIETKATP